MAKTSYAAFALLLLSHSTPAATPLRDEDDPKLARAAALRSKQPVPRCKLTYRYVPMPSPAGGRLSFHAGEIDVYPLSTYVRIGIGLEGGYAGGSLGAFYADAVLSVGLQYPGWFTPFVEGRFGVGLLGARVQGTTIPTLLYVAGVEGGVEFYVSTTAYLSASMGWSHPMYKAPDLLAYQQNPGQMPPARRFVGDAYTLRVGIGF